jgi:hypothetical protein
MSALAGALAGAGAYVLGYLLAYLLAVDRIRGSLVGAALDAAGGADWIGVGWLFYNAHLVDTAGAFGVVGVDVTGSANLIGDEFSALLYVMPVLLLVAAGVAATRATGVPADPSGAAVSGASVVVGYLPLAALGTVLFEVSGDVGSVGPALLPAVLLAGVVYPFVCGALGGIVARGTA